MEEKQALEILIQAAEGAQLKGVFDLQSAAYIHAAVNKAKERIIEIDKIVSEKQD